MDKERGGSGRRTSRRAGNNGGRESQEQQPGRFPTVATVLEPKKHGGNDGGSSWQAE